MAKAKEIQRLVINKNIEVGSVLIEVNELPNIVTEIAQLDDGTIRVICTSKINGMAYSKNIITEDVKSIWQKAQQQQK